MRVLVCGGRTYSELRVTQWLTAFDREVSCVIEGGAAGADLGACIWADQNKKELETYPADWGKYGKRAGFIRNQQMLDEGKPDLVIAFPGGKGTAMMVKLARKAGVEVIEVAEDGSIKH